MAGFGALIYGVALAISGGKHAIGNMECKSRPMTLPNGIQYYNDMDGKHRLYDGRQIFWKQYGEREKVVDLKGNVIYDRGAEIDREAKKIENALKRDCEQSGKSLYLKRNPRCNNIWCWFEYKTGKQLAKLSCEFDCKTGLPVFRKWYFYDYGLESFKRRNPHIDINSLPPDYFDCMVKTSYGSTEIGDKGIIITKEEFDKYRDEVEKLSTTVDGLVASL